MLIKRKQNIKDSLRPGRALIVYGPRRIGKTTAVKEYLKYFELDTKDKRTFFATGDDIKLRSLFNSEIRDDILAFARLYDLIIVDEAQNIQKLGIAIKIIIDEFPEKIIILTGSSSFQISQNIGEPLTGRHYTLNYLPFAQSEIEISDFERKNKLEEYLLYGSYPEVLSTEDVQEKQKILYELVSSYLYKDILAIENIRSPDALIKIVKCLAFQIGNEVSINEIAKVVQLDGKTVQKYIDLLEKMFVIKRITPYSNNLRNEISKKCKYYFLDLGIRNAAISQFNSLSDRDDMGGLWENFIFMELYKKSNIAEDFASFYFWRTHTGHEVDIVKVHNNELYAYECKWSTRKSKGVALFKEEYKDKIKSIEVVSRDNYLKILE